jgi:hypothetical protein
VTPRRPRALRGVGAFDAFGRVSLVSAAPVEERSMKRIRLALRDCE